MNRRKKMINKLKKKAKKSNEKNVVSNKPKYISKAEREKLALSQSDDQAENQTDVTLTEITSIEQADDEAATVVANSNSTLQDAQADTNHNQDKK
ncbi:DUF2986 domain-containing protein [Algibacillus agarilyticus]|uniref:DUF2986 domain-containing protein n=1 Tax=Algibacillus agarilyticus TaxID=2234133 RepID=UPI000DD07025